MAFTPQGLTLDYLFIGGFSMGVSGAACATVLSQLVSAVLCFLRIRSGFPILHISKNDLEWDKERMRLLYQNGLAMALMSSLVNCGTLILQTGINKLGTNIIVAHTAARKVFEIFSLPVSVFGASMAQNPSGLKGSDWNRLCVQRHYFYFIAYDITVSDLFYCKFKE